VRLSFKKLCLTLLFPLLISGCGEGTDVFEMAASTTMAIGAAEISPVQFIVDPETQTGDGILMAQVNESFSNRRTLSIEELKIELQYDNIGTVRVHLNPNLESTATVYRLNQNNQLFGTHNMLLNIIVETPDQNLTVDNVMLASDTATLTLVEPIPNLSFLFQGTQETLQTLSFQVVIPAELITSPFDPN